MAAYEEQQKLEKEDEASKTKAENGYDRSGHVELLSHYKHKFCLKSRTVCAGVNFKGFLGGKVHQLCRDVFILFMYC